MSPFSALAEGVGWHAAYYWLEDVVTSKCSVQAIGAGNSSNTVMSRDGAVPSHKSGLQLGQNAGSTGLQREQMP